MAEGFVQDKVILVTGAGRGIGRAIAGRLAEEGAGVGIADIDEAAAQAAAKDIAGAGGQALGLACDVADRDSVRTTIQAMVDQMGRLDVIFNNAAVAEIRPFMQVREQDWQRLMNVNGLGVLICMQEAARQMISQGNGGRIINTSSIAGREGYDLQPHYSASKFAVIALTQAGARAFAEHGITVNAFGPGVVHTELWEQLDKEFMEQGLSTEPGEAMAGFASRALLGRHSTPQDLVGVAGFLASDDANYITGQTIMVDGGMVMH